ncbi:lactonase family protein [Enterococcus sp. LJL128]|uniref:lactonase family protein n=1 Tax=Enterococcus sp. LJL51 TaxID=3416656 RepID=UPI003CF62C2A
MSEKILLGTYTRRISKGIHEITLDTDKGELTTAELVAEAKGPTYVTESQAGKLYSVIEIGEEGGAGAFKPAGGSFELLNAVTEEGAPHCYVAVDEERQLVYGANYHRGMVYSHRILEDGSLELADKITHDEETGPHENQNKAHVHYTDLTPDKRLAVCDLGTDRVYTYDVDAKGKLTEIAQYIAEPGTGPRHLVFHPNSQFAYMFGELDNTVTVLSYNKADGTFKQTQKLSTLPEDFTEFSGGAAIRITKDGRHLYASNRGHNSLAVFSVNESGDTIALVQLISTEGDFPRDFDLNATEDFVVAANQNTDNLTLYRRDQENGLLTMIQKDIFAPECVCVYFR